MKRNSFVFYDSFYLGIKELNDADRLAVYDAVVKYAIDGGFTSLNGLQNAIFSLIKPQIDANNKKYKNGKLGKGFGKLGGEYGKRGGRPKTPQKPPTEPPKNPPNVNENVNEKELLDKSNKAETAKCGNDKVNLVIQTFKKYTGKLPIDRKTRFEAHNLSRNIDGFIKRKGKEQTTENFSRVLDWVFNQLSDKDYFEHIEKLEPIRLRAVSLFDQALEPKETT